MLKSTKTITTTLLLGLTILSSFTPVFAQAKSQVNPNQKTQITVQNNKNYLKPKFYNYAGPVYGFNRNNPRLKNITKDIYDIGLYSVRKNLIENLTVYDGTELYPVNKEIKGYFSYSGKKNVDLILEATTILNSKKEGFTDKELAYFRILYYEMEDGTKVLGNDLAVRSITFNRKPYNILGKKIKRIVMTNFNNCFEVLVINTDIQLPKTLDGLKEIKMN